MLPCLYSASYFFRVCSKVPAPSELRHNPHPTPSKAPKTLMFLLHRGPADLLSKYSWSQQAGPPRRGYWVCSGLSDAEILKSEVRVQETLRISYCRPVAFLPGEDAKVRKGSIASPGSHGASQTGPSQKPYLLPTAPRKVTHTIFPCPATL